MTTHADFIEQNATEDGVLTPQQAAQLLELAEQGDTGVKPEDGGQPEATPAAQQPQKPEAEQNQGGQADPEPPADAVILAKDGKHTIPYAKLQEARQGEQHWKAVAEAAQAQLAALQRDAQSRADAGQAPTKTDADVATAQKAIDAGVDPAIFGDFSEEALAKGIAELVEQRANAIVQRHLAPIQQKEAQSAAEQHYAAIYNAHPDADSIAESAELAAWIDSKPTFVRAAYRAVLDPEKGGTAQEVVDLFTEFKNETGKSAAQPKGDQPDLKAAAKAAIAAAQPVLPSSLSDLPGGRGGAVSRFDSLEGLAPHALAEALADMSPEQREAYLNR